MGDDNPSLRRLNKLANINLIDLSNNAKQQQIFNDILNLLKIKLSEFPPGHNLKKCSDFLVYICNIVEEISKKDKRPNKKDIVLKLYKHLFNSSDDEINEISQSIDFICQNNLVNQIKKSKKLFFFVKKKVKQYL